MKKDNSFKNAPSTLNANKNSFIISYNFQNIVDPIGRAIEMYKYHASIVLIKDKVDNQNKFIWTSSYMQYCKRKLRCSAQNIINHKWYLF